VRQRAFVLRRDYLIKTSKVNRQFSLKYYSLICKSIEGLKNNEKIIEHLFLMYAFQLIFFMIIINKD
jgi:hypothetical protein